MSASATQGGHKMSLCRHSIRSTHTRNKLLCCTFTNYQHILHHLRILSHLLCCPFKVQCMAIRPRWARKFDDITLPLRDLHKTAQVDRVAAARLWNGLTSSQRYQATKTLSSSWSPISRSRTAALFSVLLLFLLAAVYTVNKVQYHDRQMPNWCNVNHLLLADWCNQWLDVNRMRRCFVTTS